MYKKGVSEVVTAILLILLAVAAVIIVWTVVKPLITGVGPKISANCVNTEVEIISYDDVAPGKSVTVKNSGSVDIDDVIVTARDANGGTPVNLGLALKVLESKPVTIPDTQPAGTWVAIDAAAKIGEVTCPSITKDLTTA